MESEGWQLAGTGRMYSGQPFTPQTMAGTTDLGEPTRPDRIANGSLANPTPERWFDVGAFPVVPLTAFHFGNSGRNILDGPGYIGINLSLSKSFQIREKGELQFRWETFNVSNHTDFKLPNVNVDIANAGTIISALPAGVIQLGLRYQF